jgi:hypothetical protein
MSARVLALALCASALLAGTARADYDPVGGGATRLALDAGFLREMKQAGISVSAAAPAKLRGNLVTFPVEGGKFDPVAGRGTVENEGALVLTSKGHSIPIKALKLRTAQKTEPFLAKIGGSQLKLGKVSALAVKRVGFDSQVRATGLALSSKATTRLGKKLGARDVFRPGMAFGTLVTETSPATITVLGKGAASLTLAPEFVAKLQSLFVAVNPIFPAEHAGAVFSLPLFGGDVSLAATSGGIDTSGSLEFLQLGGGQVFWRETRIDLTSMTLLPQLEVDPAPPFPGKVGSVPVAAMAPAGAAVADPKARTVTASYSLGLGATAAGTFNEAFAKPQGKEGVFVAGEPVGSVSLMALGQ